MVSLTLKLQEKDIKILNELLRNSKKPFIRISKDIDIADTTIHFRVNKLIEEGIIDKFTVEVNLDRVGLQYKALLICEVGHHITTELDIRNAERLVETLKKDKRIGFLALADNKKEFIALLVTNDKESFEKIISNFKGNPNIKSSKVIHLHSIEKTFIEEL